MVFCKNCGKEINKEAAYCPFCGNKPEITEEKVQNKQQKAKRWFVVIPVLLIVLILSGYFFSQYMIKKNIEEKIGQFMDTVKSGPNVETMDNILESALPKLMGDSWLTSLVKQKLSGEDIVDIYQPLMRHMEYEVVNVEKVKSGNYSVTIRVLNLNNKEVAKNALVIYKERYKGNSNWLDAVINGFRQIKSDLTSDKSELISDILAQSSDELYEVNNSENWIQGEYIIDIVKNNGQWTINTDYIDVAYTCFGLE